MFLLLFVLSCSVSSALRADEVIGIDLGTTNSCVAVMEGKVGAAGLTAEAWAWKRSVAVAGYISSQLFRHAAGIAAA
jgi:hypothetical protein